MERILDTLHPKALDDGELLALTASIGGVGTENHEPTNGLASTGNGTTTKRPSDRYKGRDSSEDDERKSRYFHCSGSQGNYHSHVDLSQLQPYSAKHLVGFPDGRKAKIDKQRHRSLAELSQMPHELRKGIEDWLDTENR